MVIVVPLAVPILVPLFSISYPVLLFCNVAGTDVCPAPGKEMILVFVVILEDNSTVFASLHTAVTIPEPVVAPVVTGKATSLYPVPLSSPQAVIW